MYILWIVPTLTEKTKTKEEKRMWRATSNDKDEIMQILRKQSLAFGTAK